MTFLNGECQGIPKEHPHDISCEQKSIFHTCHFSLVFSQYVGSNFPAVFLLRIGISTFHGLLNVFCRWSADNRIPHKWEKIEQKWPVCVMLSLSLCTLLVPMTRFCICTSYTQLFEAGLELTLGKNVTHSISIASI